VVAVSLPSSCAVHPGANKSEETCKLTQSNQ
jgi:hypothetical protein